MHCWKLLFPWLPPIFERDNKHLLILESPWHYKCSPGISQMKYRGPSCWQASELDFGRFKFKWELGCVSLTSSRCHCFWGRRHWSTLGMQTRWEVRGALWELWFGMKKANTSGLKLIQIPLTSLEGKLTGWMMRSNGLWVKHQHDGWPEKLTLREADISILKAVSQRDRDKCYKESSVLSYVSQIENQRLVFLWMWEATLPSRKAGWPGDPGKGC